MPSPKRAAPAQTTTPAGKVGAPAKKTFTAAKKAAPTKNSSAAQKMAAPVKKVATPDQKAAASVRASSPLTVTLKQFAAEWAGIHDLPRKVAEALLGDLVTLATQRLRQGDKVRLTGLGILQVRALPTRMGRNPATGEAIKIAVHAPAAPG